MKETVAPVFCPLLFQAYTAYLYAVPGLSPVTVAEIATGAVPEPTALTVLASPSGGVHWNHEVVDRPSGFTLPLNAAVVGVTAEAASVVTTGAAVLAVAAGVAAAALKVTARGMAAPITVIRFHFIT